MPVTVNEQVTDTVSSVNLKNLGEMHSLTAGLSGQNALTHQQLGQADAIALQRRTHDLALQLHESASLQAQQIAADAAALRMAMLGRVTRMILDISGEQAAAFSSQMSSNLQQKLAELGSAIAAIQQFIKGSQTTPPQTGTGGAFGSDAGNALLQQLANIQATLQSLQQDHPAPPPPAK